MFVALFARDRNGYFGQKNAKKAKKSKIRKKIERNFQKRDQNAQTKANN
jgi:hypothetical protein